MEFHICHILGIDHYMVIKVITAMHLGIIYLMSNYDVIVRIMSGNGIHFPQYHAKFKGFLIKKSHVLDISILNLIGK